MVTGDAIVNGVLWFKKMLANEPGPGPLRQAKVYLRDNGSGKEQLVVQFSSGAVQQIAIEP